MHANILQIAAPDELRALFGMLTDRSARLLNLKDYGLAVGNPADLVVIDAETPEQAIAEIRPPLAVWKARPSNRHPASAGTARASMKHGRATRLRAVVAGTRRCLSSATESSRSPTWRCSPNWTPPPTRSRRS